MKFNFDREVDRRGTDSAKWDHYQDVFGSSDLLPMWVADSDWPAPPAVIKAIKDRTEHGIFGYTWPGDELNQVVVDWVKRRYNWDIKPEWLVYTSGIVPALNIAVRSFINIGDEVIIQPPVYYPFYTAISNNGAQIVNNKLIYDGNKYSIDFDDLENKFKDDNLTHKTSRAKMMILCSPHNPVGRVWSREELEQIGEICLNNNAIVVSDEIHADLIFKGNKHISFGSISRKFAWNSITMIAPSKTFNLAGLHSSVIIIPNPELRKLFIQTKSGLVTDGNVLGFTAMKTAYSECDDWLEEQLEYLQLNMEYAIKYISDNIPEVKVVKPEGTYLLWMDFSKLGMNPAQLDRFMVEKARVGLDAGTWFGPGGEGFMRLNLATPRTILKEGLSRIVKAVKDY